MEANFNLKDTKEDYVSREEMNGNKMADALEDFVNPMINDIRNKTFIEHITRKTHRTLQQKIFSLFIQTIEAFASSKDFDPRNEYTVLASRKISDFMKKEGITHNCPSI